MQSGIRSDELGMNGGLCVDNPKKFLTPNSSFLILQGLTLDSVWDNIVISIGDIQVEQGKSVAEQISADDQRAKILAQIAVLERKMANEKQPRRKREYFEQIKKLKAQI